jgi:hypothetical protein
LGRLFPPPARAACAAAEAHHGEGRRSSPSGRGAGGVQLRY